MRNPNRNKNEGLHFEAVFVHRATLSGYWAHKHELSFRYLKGGKILPIRSELDFALIAPDGRIAFVDTKSFEGKTFARSALNPVQLARSVRYCDYNVPSGFVVHFRTHDLVSFFPGWLIHRAQKGTGFAPNDGRVLGAAASFVLEPILAEFDVMGVARDKTDGG